MKQFKQNFNELIFSLKLKKILGNDFEWSFSNKDIYLYTKNKYKEQKSKYIKTHDNYIEIKLPTQEEIKELLGTNRNIIFSFIESNLLKDNKLVSFDNVSIFGNNMDINLKNNNLKTLNIVSNGSVEMGLVNIEDKLIINSERIEAVSSQINAKYQEYNAADFILLYTNIEGCTIKINSKNLNSENSKIKTKDLVVNSDKLYLFDLYFGAKNLLINSNNIKVIENTTDSFKPSINMKEFKKNKFYADQIVLNDRKIIDSSLKNKRLELIETLKRLRDVTNNIQEEKINEIKKVSLEKTINYKKI